MAEYAKVIVDISQEKLDKTFEYRIPPYLTQRIAVGMQVYIPFGSRRITGYVVELSDEAEYDEDKLKNIAGIVTDSVPIESHLIALAGWMREHYGGTMNQALKMVLPIKEKKKAVEHKRVRLALHPVEAKNQLGAYERRHSTARAKLLRALLEEEELDWDLVTHKLGVSGSVIRAMEESGVVKVIRETQYRNPVSHLTSRGYGLTLNDEQQEAVDAVWSDYEKGIRSTYLIKGVTGSGKTEVYMELIAKMQKAGRQAIVLIPEIALTYQTVLRFYNRFGDRVSILNSRMSPGERYDQFLRAKNGEIDVMIGPRSALFTPFANLGLIIIDEEHETSYKSETVPRYHARETAIARAGMLDASVVLGSATPSVDSYYPGEARGIPAAYAHKAREGKTASGMRGGGSAAGIKRGQPLHPKPQVRRADGAAPAGGRTDHALYQPQGRGGVCLLQSLRTCDKMSALRCIAEPACERTDGLPLLRVYGAGAGTMSDVRIEVHQRV